MNLDQCYYLGYISRTWNNSNKVSIKLDTDKPERYKKLESVLVRMHKQDQNPVPFFIHKFHSLKGSELTVEIDLGDQFPDGDFLKGKSLYLPLSELPKLKGNKFYYHEVIDFKVMDEKKGEIGKIIDIIDNTSNPLLSIANGDQEILIPILDEIILDVNREDKSMTISAPEGLIDLYLNS